MNHLLKNTHLQWHDILAFALSTMDKNYLNSLENNNDWLPGKDKLFAAFEQPLDKVNYILLGESPYPRPQSAA